MSKLDTLNRNIARHKSERKAAIDSREMTSSRITRSTQSEPHTLASVMDPPQHLIDLYCTVLKVYATENVLADCTLTNEQMKSMMEETLMDQYNQLKARGALLMSNRDTYWKPRVELTACPTFRVYLGHVQIATIC